MDTSTSWTMPGPGWLFCPADRPERYAKAAAAADVVILDLEDAVNPADKPAARQALIDAFNCDGAPDVETIVVRVNAATTDEFAADLVCLEQLPVRRVMLAKTETRADVDALPDHDVIALIESPLGAVNAAEIAAAPNVAGFMWGSEDLTAGLGGRRSRLADGSYHPIVQQVRGNVLLAAKAHGCFALDSVFMDIGNLLALRAEADDAVAIGFDAKVAIHPKQVATIRDAYAPTDEQIDWATRLMDAAKRERGVFTFEGQMVDGPVFKQAEQILRRAN